MPEHKHTNKLINEKSPYLLQHAHNPVDWYPWSPEAFARAVGEDKPIFLSIGYSTCHWCHVMERECFEDQEVAEKLNENFISIKVDREERPDIDSIYMSVCQSLTGSGGWPLSVFLTPDAKPFYAGTYFPKHDRYGIPGFLSILDAISREWRSNRGKLIDLGSRITSSLSETKTGDDNMPQLHSLPGNAYESLSYSYDSVYGGFGKAPKFPTPHNLMFLLRYWYATGNSHALSMAEETLEMMYRGGIFDHIGFGFSRYSTDRKWLVPHFEKMLYDNALLAMAYLEAFLATGKNLYKSISGKIFEYILRDMTSPEGGFYSAEDADSEGEEGKFYVWTVDEVIDILGNDKGKSFCEIFGISKDGNFEGKNIPNLIESGIQQDESFISECRQLLFNYRESRIRPFKDDKILTSWNSLMIAAMAMGSRITGNNKYTEAAEKAASFILSSMVDKTGRLLARYRHGESAIPAFAEDYSYFIWALLELYTTTHDPEHLENAIRFCDQQLELFWDNEGGGLFLYGNDSEQLITRPKEAYDGAMPSSNSVSAMNMIRLSRLTGGHVYEDRAYEIFKAFYLALERNPSMYTHMMSAVLFSISPSLEIVITGETNDSLAVEMLELLNKRFLPFTSVIFYGSQNRELERTIPFLFNYSLHIKKTAAFVCKNQTCSQPIYDAAALEKAVSTEHGEHL